MINGRFDTFACVLNRIRKIFCLHNIFYANISNDIKILSYFYTEKYNKLNSSKFNV